MVFKYDDLKAFLRHIKANYPVTPLAEWDGSNTIILRQDVDLDIQPAYDMALIQEECGIRSTFFILTTCHTYNPMSQKNRRLLREMAEKGFEIGLHFDPLIYGDVPYEALQRQADFEAGILESLIGQKIRSVAVHTPSIHGQFLGFAGYHNAYDERIFSPDRYMSDSRMILRHDIYEFVKGVAEKPIQILFHPLHFTEQGGGYPEIMLAYMRRTADYLDAYFNAANATYTASLPDGLFAYLMK